MTFIVAKDSIIVSRHYDNLSTSANLITNKS